MTGVDWPGSSAVHNGLFGSILSGIGAYLAVRFLTRYLDRRSLRPFGVYCLIAGFVSMLRFTIG